MFFVIACSEDTLPESHRGFSTSLGTTDIIFVARQLHEKCREQSKDIYKAFIDLTKAFDSTNREALWNVMSILCYPSNFIIILRLTHDKMTATVLIKGIKKKPFTIHTGVKQGCFIAPTLFAIYLCAYSFLCVTAFCVDLKMTVGSMGDFST